MNSISPENFEPDKRKPADIASAIKKMQFDFSPDIQDKLNYNFGEYLRNPMNCMDDTIDDAVRICTEKYGDKDFPIRTGHLYSALDRIEHGTALSAHHKQAMNDSLVTLQHIKLAHIGKEVSASSQETEINVRDRHIITQCSVIEKELRVLAKKMGINLIEPGEQGIS